MSGNLVVNDDNSWDRNIEWFSVEALHRMMRRHKMPIEKTKLRKLLTNLANKEPPLVEIQEGGKQDRPQAKGEYRLTDEGKFRFREYLKQRKIITD
jgi:hypothetical protein